MTSELADRVAELEAEVAELKAAAADRDGLPPTERQSVPEYGSGSYMPTCSCPRDQLGGLMIGINLCPLHATVWQ